MGTRRKGGILKAGPFERHRALQDRISGSQGKKKGRATWKKRREYAAETFRRTRVQGSTE